MKNIRTRTITGLAILLAIEIILQILGNILPSLGPVSLNLSLIPIAVAAILFGPVGGAFLGLSNGILVLFAPTTQIFWQTTAWGTLVVCLLKCTIAGVLAGLAYKALMKKNQVFATIVASLIIPVVNTGLFILACFTVFKAAIDKLNVDNASLYTFVFLVVVGWNFIFEFGVTSLLSPTIVKIVSIYRREE